MVFRISGTGFEDLPVNNLSASGSVSLPPTTSIGNVSSTEISYVDGVTSALQTQIDTKAPSASPTFTGTVTLPSTTAIGDVSSTEIGYLDGVTSSIQTQIVAANIFSIQVERSGGFTSGGGQLGAFGNGASDGYMILPFNVDLVFATMRVNSAHTGTTTVQFNIGGANQGTSYQLTCSGAGSSATGNYTSNPLRVNAGQGFNFACTAISGTLGTTVLSAMFARV